jgi:hypothetical protein
MLPGRPSKARKRLGGSNPSPPARPQRGDWSAMSGSDSEFMPTRDISAADWLMERLWAWHREKHPPVRVGSFIPTGFDAYARLFHPVWFGPERTHLRWSEIAERNQRTLHPETAFRELAEPGDAGPHWTIEEADAHPADGNLPEEECKRLAHVLEPFTAVPDRCWFAVWDGWGDLPTDLDRLPKAEAPFGRRYVLFEESLRRVRALVWSQFFQSPSLWWPDDRAWCVSTEIDDYSTFVGGSDACIKAVLGERGLEAMRTWVGARGDFGPYPPRDE